MKTTRLFALPALCFASIAAVVCLGGCSLKKAYPAKQTFLIEAGRVGETRVSSSAAPSVLRVRNLQVIAPFEGRGFVYRDSELRYESDFYHEFLVAPRALLAEQVRQWLAASALFRTVIDAASKAGATHLLDGHVSALYGDYRDTSSLKAVLAIEFFVTRESSAPGDIVFHKSYRQEIAIENRAPESLAKSWGKALEQILTSLEEDLAVAFRK